MDETSKPASADLGAPVAVDTVLEVRRGRMQLLAGSRTVRSGIDKGLCEGPVSVTEMGLVEDEHDYTFHGGVDKAVHAYCAAHYAAWQHEFPAAADRFRPGGFGENLVFARFNERNVHIGDVFVVGPDADDDDDDSRLLLQVSLPRQPCFKLNQRFGVRNFAPRTWQTSRTGWYYRVLRPGRVQAGDAVRLVRRPHPAWPLERVQEFLHRQPDNMPMVAALAAIDDLGAECRNAFRRRLAKLEAAAQRRAAAGGGGGAAVSDSPVRWRPYRVVEKTQQTPRIASFVLEVAGAGAGGGEDADADLDEALDPGSHVRLRLGGGGSPPLPTAVTRCYSVVGGDRRRFEIGVSFDAAAGTSRGGARFLHERVGVGSVVQAGGFAAGVPVVAAAGHHVFVAGGVGVTAFLAQLAGLTAIHYSCELHYAVRSADEVAFADRLRALGGGTVVVYDAARGQRLDLAGLVAGLPWNAHISFCGPPRLLDAARAAVRAARLDPADVHFEAFDGDATGDPFEAVVHREGAGEGGPPAQTVAVAGAETLLEALQRTLGADAVASSCGVGNCGTCKIAVRAGRVAHRGAALTEEEKAAGDCMLACVSRGIGRIEVVI